MIKYLITFLPLILSFVNTQLFVGNYKNHDKWYRNLYKPKETPPSWSFGVVWPILYLLMGIALSKINKIDQCHIFDKMCAPLIYFFIQLFLNYLWPILFFKKKNLKLSLYTIIVLLFFVMKTYWNFKIYDESASEYLIPYVLWIIYATFLNYKIEKLNRNRDNIKN